MINYERNSGGAMDKKREILIVDDDQDFATTLAYRLEAADASVKVAMTAAAGSTMEEDYACGYVRSMICREWWDSPCAAVPYFPSLIRATPTASPATR